MTTEIVENMPPSADSAVDVAPDGLDSSPAQAELPIADTVSEQPDVTAPPAQVAPPATEVTSTNEVPASPQVPVQPQYAPGQLERMQQDAAQYAQVQQRAVLQTQADQYKQQLEAQGYLPEHAEQAANNYMQGQQQQATLMQQAEQYGRHLQGQQAAAEQFAAKYKLGISDLAALRVYNDPQSMEQAAKKLSGDRERDMELARLKQAQVPAQAFDNSQGNPQVAADEGGWLDRYNGGDRSPSAQAAARKAAGLA